MLQNYFKVALRNFFKHRLFFFINLIGLAVGLSVCLLIVLFVKDELSYDNFHTKADRILLFQQFENASGSGSAFAALIQSEIAQVEKTARLVKAKALIGTESQSFYEDDFYFADSTVFDLFDFPLVEGNSRTALRAPHNLLISEAMAQKYFPNENPIGKTLEYGNKQDLTITGILKNTPRNAHIHIDFLCAYQSKDELLGYDYSGYWNSNNLTYLLLSPGTQPSEIIAQLPKVAEKTKDPNAMVWHLSAIPLRDIYLKYKLDDRVKAQGAIENVWIFSIVAIFILALACFNYVNLVTARASTRAREVGVRKVLGAQKKQLLGQFLSESSLVLTIAVLFALLIVQIVLPGFNQFIDKGLSLISLLNATDVAIFLSVFALVCFITGSYPALILASFQPVTVLKNAFFGNQSDAFFRKVLVLLQFTVSIAMIVATMVVMNQLSYIQHKDLGYQREQVLTFTFQGGDNVTEQQRQQFKQEVARLAAVQSLSLCTRLPGQGAFQNKMVEDYVPKGKNVGYSSITTDEHFLETFDIPLKDGRFFDANSSPDKNQFVVNESMAKYMEWKDGAIGKKIGYYTYQPTADGGYAEMPVVGEVIGVVADYHQSDLKTPIYPMIFTYSKAWNNELAIRLEGGQIRNTVEAIHQKWNAFFPKEPFDYKFLDEAFDQTYAKETKTGQVFSIFAGLAIFISCLGLLGLVAFAAERRTKEIGIRKILGASLLNLIYMLTKDFIQLVLFSAFIAFPLAWWAMNRWLERFAYRIEIQWWMLVLVGVGALAIAFLTVSFQAIRTARANPIERLRSE